MNSYQLFVSKHWNPKLSWGENIRRIAEMWKNTRKAKGKRGGCGMCKTGGKIRFQPMPQINPPFM